ncbi:hypothetical protein IWQ57_000660 [Coemansia nantahalensis]|uniref:Uncharacterized protein n=1 Tax=Coemansia nantahalensis TaxID=2789366 RepID=A0ACC1K6T3_9FUNG|nr:hypothetical protein IWQ57_000660 [Coemansia nantahalensis]
MSAHTHSDAAAAMDSFMRNIRSQTFPLCGWDMASAFANIPFTFYFKNPSDDPAVPFMSSAVLYASFLRALQEFPILAGHLVINSSGPGFVVVDRDNLNMPEYAESQSPIHYSFIEAAKFSWDAVPHDVVTVTSTPTRNASGVIKLANINIIRLRGNSGLILFANIPHYVVDGVGYSAFMRRWAEVCMWMQGGGDEKLPSRQYDFDRAAIARALPLDMDDMSPAIKKIYDVRSMFGQLLSWLSPGALGDFLTAATRMVPTTTHTFHITSAAVDTLRECVAGGECSRRISDNDILCALISHAVAQGIRADAERPENNGLWAQTKRAAARFVLGNADEFMSLIAIDIRPRLDKLKRAQYVGGAITGIPVFYPMSDIAQSEDPAKVLATGSSGIRQMVDGLTGPFVSRIDHSLNSDPTCHSHAWAQVIVRARKVTITNQSRFGLYECDFGSGAPAWISWPPTFVANLAAILPRRANADGYDLYLSVEKQIMTGILENKLWNDNTRLLY